MVKSAIDQGIGMFQLMERLFPICRSLTGDGVRQTLDILSEHIPLQRFEVPTGTQVFDWQVPKEWNIKQAYITDVAGHKIVDFEHNNLHVMGYSTPVDQWLELADLQAHLYSLEDQPDAIPYITSYYQPRWGFCLSHRQRQGLKPGRYRVVIDSELSEGHLSYAEFLLPGQSDQEIFISTYVCHPSMANNELSGPVLVTFLAKWLQSMPRKYTYRIIFIPETIGAITYLSSHAAHLKDKVIAAFNVSCVGDERVYSFIPSRYGKTLADKVALNILHSTHPDFIHYSYLDRASDERQYCAPGIDLPLVGLTRSKYGCYPEYHTSLDNLSFVTPAGLQGSFELYQSCIEAIERNKKLKVTCICEPQLGKRGLYPNLGSTKNPGIVRNMMNLLAYADGSNDLIDISNIIGVPLAELYPIVDKLSAAGLMDETD